MRNVLETFADLAPHLIVTNPVDTTDRRGVYVIEPNPVKKSTLPLILGLCAVGLLSGFVGKRLTRSGTASAPAQQVSPQEKTVGSDENSSAAPTVSSRPITAKKSSLHSTDTLETLATLDNDSLYSRLALWMMDASEQDIAAYWATAKDKKNRPNEITDLIFINWTRLDPQAAIAAVAGTGNEHYAWWAWAGHDPKGALAAAIAAGSKNINNVAWGIGEFHGDWLREHWDQIPESARGVAIRGMVKWDDTDKPEEILDFLKKNGQGFNQGIFASLIRKDPWAAYDWIQKNGTIASREYGTSGNAMEMLVKSMGELQPDALQRLADQTPSGEAKRNMEAVLFDNLLKTDPAAALEQAKSTQAPRVAVERLAAVGLSLAQTDPDKALEIAQKLFSIYPGALSGMTWIQHPNGSSGSGSSMKGVEELVDGLMDKDPAKVMAMLPLPAEGAYSDDNAFSSLAGKWAKQDLVAYTNWVNQQSDPKIRDEAASVVISQLTQQHHYEEAVDWAMSSSKSSKNNLWGIFYQWNLSNPAEAKTWLESADIPDSQKAEYKANIQSIESRRDQ